ncbi:unnamed protein product [Pylaiella littoralis]
MIREDNSDSDDGDATSPTTSGIETPGAPVVLARRDSSSNGSVNGTAPDEQQAEGGPEREDGTGGPDAAAADDASRPLLQQDSGSIDGPAAAAGDGDGYGDVNGDAGAAGAAQRRHKGYGKGGGRTRKGDPAAVETIQKLLRMVPVDLEKLRNLAWEKGGYQTDEVRLKVWPKLLSLDRHGLEDFRQYLETPHEMTDQIQRDIDRSLTHFVHIRKWKRHRQRSKREKLRDVINAVVRKYDGVLNYYQGYHDVVAVLLLVTGDTKLTYALTERASHYFFRDCMRTDFGVLTYLMHLLPAITLHFDPELSAFVSKCKVEPYYCMSWVLTWFAHDLKELPAVSRLYDVLLGAHPTLILYICAAVVITARKDVLACECEFSAVHNALSFAAKGVKDWEAVLQKAKGMFLKRPPRELVLHAPAYMKETLVAGGITSLEFPPPWFTGTSLPDWILLEQSREKESKKRIGKAAKHWRRAAKVAGAENPDEMLKAYLESGHHHPPGTGPGSLVKRVLARVRIRPKNWKIYPSPAAVLSTAVLIGAMSYSFHVSLRQHPEFFP